MKCDSRPDEAEKLVRLKNSDSELQSQLDADALRLIPKHTASLAPPQRTVSRTEKAMAASVPGTEYWLP
jgi:hypothetical protein